MFSTSKLVTSILISISILSVQAVESPNSILGLRAASASPSVEKTKSLGLRYVPPKLPSRRGLQRTQGAGSRGQGDVVEVTLLAPTEPTGQTASGHPTFFWYVSFSPSASSDRRPVSSVAPLEFTLVETKVAKPLFVKRIEVKQPGLVKLEMPQNLPELKPGKEYRWTVSVLRNALRRSENPTFYSFITRVALTPDQAKQLKAATSTRDQAAVYAQSGIWYDALGAIATSYLNKPSDPNSRTDLVTLLDQIGLTQVLKSSNKK